MITCCKHVAFGRSHSPPTRRQCEGLRPSSQAVGGRYSVARYSRRQLANLAAAATSFLALSKRSGLAAGASTQADNEAKLSFFAVGDWGQRGSDPQKKVAAAMTQIAEERAPTFIISLGDNFYPNGVVSAADEQWHQSFESVYSAPSLQVPWYPVLGNHDRKGVAMAQVAYSQLSSRGACLRPTTGATSRCRTGRE
jgi:hypothetical protein